MTFGGIMESEFEWSCLYAMSGMVLKFGCFTSLLTSWTFKISLPSTFLELDAILQTRVYTNFKLHSSAYEEYLRNSKNWSEIIVEIFWKLFEQIPKSPFALLALSQIWNDKKVSENQSYTLQNFAFNACIVVNSTSTRILFHSTTIDITLTQQLLWTQKKWIVLEAPH